MPPVMPASAWPGPETKTVQLTLGHSLGTLRGISGVAASVLVRVGKIHYFFLFSSNSPPLQA